MALQRDIQFTLRTSCADPLDSRAVYSTLAERNAEPVPYRGQLCYVLATEEVYKLDNLNGASDGSGWTAIGQGSGGSTFDINAHSVTELRDVTDAGSGRIITIAERNRLARTASTPQEVKTQYESNADTNAFTDAQRDKLDNSGISGQTVTIGGDSVTVGASGASAQFNTAIADRTIVGDVAVSESFAPALDTRFDYTITGATVTGTGFTVTETSSTVVVVAPAAINAGGVDATATVTVTGTWGVTGLTQSNTFTETFDLLVKAPGYLRYATAEPTTGFLNTAGTKIVGPIEVGTVILLDLNTTNDFVSISLPNSVFDPQEVRFFSNGGGEVGGPQFTAGNTTGYTTYCFSDTKPQLIQLGIGAEFLQIVGFEEIGGLTRVAADALYSQLGHRHPSTDITDSTVIGRGVLTATTAADVRTLIGAGLQFADQAALEAFITDTPGFRTYIGAGTSNFSGNYSDLNAAPNVSITNDNVVVTNSGTTGSISIVNGQLVVNFPTVATGGSQNFLGLDDTPSAYTHPGDLAVVNAANDGLTFVPNVPNRTAVAGSSKVFTWGGLTRSGGSQVLEVDLVGQGDDFFHLLGGGTGQISTTTLQTYTLRGSGASSALPPLVIPIGTRIVHAEDAVTFRFPTLAASNAADTFFVNAGAFVADRDFVAPEIQAGNEITITEDAVTGNAIISSTASATQASSIPPFDPTEGYTRAYTPVTSNVNGGGLYRLRLGQTVNPAEGTLIETTFLRHGLVGATPYFFIGLEETLERATVTGNVLTVSYSIDNVTYTGTFDPADIRFQGATTTLTEGTLLFVLVSDITFGTAGSGLATLAPLESEDLEAPQLTYALAGAIISNLDPALNPTDWEEFADTSVNILGTDAIIEVEKGQLAFDTRRLPGDNIGSDGPFEVLTDQSDADSTTSFSVNWQVSDDAPPYTGGGKRTLLTIDPLYIVEPNTLNVPSSIRTEHNGSVIVFSLSGVNSGDPARSNPGFDFSGYTFRVFTDVAQAADGIRRSYVFRSDDTFTRGTDIAINVNDLISGDTDYILNDIRSINRMETLRPELVLEGREQANSIVNTSARLWTFTISGLSTNREPAVVRDIVAQGYINGDTARVSLTEAIDDSIVAVRTGANITNALSDLTTPAEATALGGTIVNFTDGDWEVLTNEGIRVIGRSNLSISNDNIDYIITDSSPLVEGTADGRKEVMIEDGVATYVEAVDTDTVTAYDLVFNESATRWTKNAADLVIGYPSQGDVPVTDLLATYRIELRDMSSNNIAATLLIPGSDFEIAQNVATLQVLAENIPANADYDALADGTSVVTTTNFPAVTIDSTRPMTGIRPGSGITHSIDDDGLVSLSVASQSNGGGGSVTVQEGISLISPTNIIFGFITPISTANSLGLFTIRFSNEDSRDEFFTILGATGRNEVTINHDITLTKSIGADLPLLTGTFPNRTEFQVVLGTTTDVEVDMPNVAQVRAFTAGLNPIFAQSTYTISHSSRIHSIEAGTGIEISSTAGAATLSTTTEETHVLSTDVDGALDIREW